MNKSFDSFLQKLVGIGLSSNEAMIYMALLEKSPLTGYQLAKKCNLARGNIYSTLERLVEKGTLQKTIDRKYMAIDLQQFLKMRLSFFSDCADYLKNNYKSLNFVEMYESAFFIYGKTNILNHTKDMITRAKDEISLVAFKEELGELRELLVQAIKRNIKIHIMNVGKPDTNFNLNGIDIVAHSEKQWKSKSLQGHFLAAVKDKDEGLSGVIYNDENSIASWSKNPHYCISTYLYIAHEIALIKVFNLLDKSTILKIRKELKDDYSERVVSNIDAFDN